MALPLAVSTSTFIQYLVDKPGRSLEHVLEKVKVKINMKLSDYQKFILETTWPKPTNLHSEDAGLLLARMLGLQQMVHQFKLLQTIAFVLQAANKLRFKMVKPDIFDGAFSNPECWINFYEHACGPNNWQTVHDKVKKNLCLFLDGMAKKYYELCVLLHEYESWQEWQDNFLSSFGQKLQAWQRAIA